MLESDLMHASDSDIGRTSKARPMHLSIMAPMYSSAVLGIRDQDGTVQFESPREKLKAYMWSWDSNSVSKENVRGPSHLSDDNSEVTFHTSYSSGTEGVRGDTPLISGYDHYWEIKIVATPYGTDLMVGVGTDKVTLSKPEYCSLLGQDGESWGLSYRGNLQHNGKWFEDYGPKLGKGDIVGVHLNTWNGILTFYVNGQCLGAAFNVSSDKVVYPMACATAAFSQLQLIYSYSHRASLQSLCLHAINAEKDMISDVRAIPGLCIFADRISLDDVRVIVPARPDKTSHLRMMLDDDDWNFSQRPAQHERSKRIKYDKHFTSLSFRERCELRFSSTVHLSHLQENCE